MQWCSFKLLLLIDNFSCKLEHHSYWHLYLDVLLLLNTFFHFFDLLLLLILGDDGQLWDPCFDTLLVTGSVEDTWGTWAGIDVTWLWCSLSPRLSLWPTLELNRESPAILVLLLPSWPRLSLVNRLEWLDLLSFLSDWEWRRPTTWSELEGGHGVNELFLMQSNIDY